MTTSPLLRVIKNKRGSALLLSFFSVILLSAIAIDVQYSTQIDALTARQSINRLKAYYAAKAGIEISLLRILIYKKAVAQFGKILGDNAQLLEEIWQFPVAWPPPIPDSVSGVDKDLIKKTMDESVFDGQFLTTIESEGSKIDINDLISPSKVLRESTKEKIISILKQRLETLDRDDPWVEEYTGFDFEKLVNNIIDWIDKDSDSLNGGDESALYRELGVENIPPNRPFKTLQELHLIANMEDGIYDVLAPLITIYGTKGIFINHSSKEVLMSLDSSITEEIANEVLERIQDKDLGGPFKGDDDFYGFLEEKKVDVKSLKDKKVPLIFDSELNFRITSIGQYSNVSRKIVAIVYDFDRVKERLTEILLGEKDQTKGSGPDDSGKTPPVNPGQPDKDKKADADKKGKDSDAKKEPPKGRPNVVYWFES